MDNTRIVDLDQFSELQEAEHIGNETVDSVEEDEGETLDSEGKQPKTESEKVRGNEVRMGTTPHFYSTIYLRTGISRR